MADDIDIDIEEHDVLDNPALKSMFPDISVLKQEIKDFETDVEAPLNSSIKNKNEGTSSEILHSIVIDDDDVIEEIDGSVRDSPKSEESIFNNNRIILGSKPNKALECGEDFFENQVKSYNVSIILDDMKSYLNNSGRFCKECLVLFPNSFEYDNHNESFHVHVIENGAKVRKSQDDLKLSFKSGFSRHMRQAHNGTYTAQKIKKFIPRFKINRTSKVKYKSKGNTCFHCKKLFPTQQTLIEHLYSTLQPSKYKCKECSQSFKNVEQLNKHNLTHKKCVVMLKNVANELQNVTSETNKCYEPTQNIPEEPNLQVTKSHCNASTSEQFYYKCDVCSYYFIESKSLSTHLASKHNINKTDDMRKEKFDPLCKYCSKTCAHMLHYNRHLSQSHREHTNFWSLELNRMHDNSSLHAASTPTKSKRNMNEMTKTNNIRPPISDEKQLLMKTALFKCSKCDIHFLSSKLAINHVEHMEMLINWKCLKCNHIFKKEDESMHEVQHENSQEFTVYDLCPVTSPPILYNCPKCSVHFDENNFLKHYLACKNNTQDSIFCIICDIMIDNALGKSHRSEHISKSLKQSDFIIVNSDIIITEAAVNKLEIAEKKINEPLKRKCTEKSVLPCKNEYQTGDMFDLIYCYTCKCFLSKTEKREFHIKKRCHDIEKHNCKICGLVLTSQSYTTTHRNLHNLTKNVKLKDFRFYDIKSFKRICPPIPEYLKCENCDVYLISKEAIFSHICCETEYLTCHLCNINLTDDAFKLHMQFHNYTKINLENETHPNGKNHGKLAINKIIKNKNSEESKPGRPQRNSMKKFEKREPLVSQKPLKRNNRKKTKLVKIKDDRNKLIATQIKLKENKRGSMITNKESKLTETINLDGIVYQCRNCHVSVDSYDKVIEHCQGHYCNDNCNTEIVECQICGLSLDNVCFEKHKQLHLLNQNKDFFTILNFDTFYFTSENKIWIEHIFGTLSQTHRDNIIQESIYKYECRIKMEVIQNGPSDLTVYKCDKCRMFVDARSLYKHSENSCFKLRKHPCSICGLPFNSSVSRIEHELIHETPDINLESYRIVTFNKEEETYLNKLLFRRSQYYVLYQCRNCTVTIEKSQTLKHECCQRNLKLCSACGLLLLNEDFDNHILRHKELLNFTQKNIKIILVGGSVENAKDKSNDVVSAFSGIVYDYTFYSCSKCEVCEKSNGNLDKHTCYFGANRLKCSKCKLYFLTSKLKQHLKLHETDPEFSRENMRVITFNSDFAEDESTAIDTPITILDDDILMREITESQHNSNIDLNMKNIDTNDSTKTNNNSGIEEKYAKIYKCACGLHYLDQVSIVSHSKVCDPKARLAKQSCSKCSLLFTAEVLFDHLIMHHGNKTQIYKFNIIDITENNIIYRCSKCNLHFAKVENINEHFKDCNSALEGKDCIFCHLKFESVSFISHNCNNVENVNANVEVLDLDEPLLTKSTVCREIKEMNISGKELNKAIVTNSERNTIVELQCNELLPVANTTTENNQSELTTSSNSSCKNQNSNGVIWELNEPLVLETSNKMLKISQTSDDELKKQIPIIVSSQPFTADVDDATKGNNTNMQKEHQWRSQRKEYKKHNKYKPPWQRNSDWRYGGPVWPRHMGPDRFRPSPYHERRAGPVYPNYNPMWRRNFNEKH